MTQTEYNRIMASSAELFRLDPYTAHHGRTHEAARCRSVAWYVMHVYHGCTQAEIARQCKWQRVTVWAGIERIMQAKANDTIVKIAEEVARDTRCNNFQA